MANRIYLMPLHEYQLPANPAAIIQTPKYGYNETGAEANHPESIFSSGGQRRWYNGFELVVLVMFKNVTQGQHDLIAAKPDVITFPENLDEIISGADIGSIKSQLRAFNIPDAWVGAPISYRLLMRNVMLIFNLGQQYTELFQAAGERPTPLVSAGNSLNTTGAQLNATDKSRVQTLMTRMGRGAIQNNTSMAAMLEGMMENLVMRDGKPYPQQNVNGELV